MISEKKLFFLRAISALFLMTPAAFAIEPWTGVKTLVQFDFGDITAVVVEMNSNHGTASVTTGPDAGHGTYQVANDEIEITLTTPISSIGFPTLFNPYTGRFEQVETINNLKSFTLTEVADNSLQLLTKGTTCQRFRDTNGQQRENCQNYEDTFKDGVFQALAPRPVQTSFKEGDRIVLPIASISSAYLKILANDKVENITQYNISGFQLSSLKKVGPSLEAILKNGDTISYTRIAQRNDDELVLGIIRGSNNLIKGYASGTIVKDEKVNTLALDFTGQYIVGGFGGLTTSGDEFVINFFDNGLGGFDFYDPISDETNRTIWSWEPTKNGMKATRWFILDDSGNLIGMANTEQEVKSCRTGSIKCYPFQKREYSIIAKDGNKYTMLRRMESNYRPNDPNATPDINYTVNYLYKK